MQQVLQANDCCQLPTKSPSKLHTVHDIMVADDVHLLFLHPQQSKNFIFTFILQFQPKAKDIFLLGCCDHSSFSLCFSSSCVHFIFTFIFNSNPRLRMSFYQAVVITDFVITVAFHYVSQVSCAHSHLSTLLVKHLPIEGAVRAVSQTVTHHTITSVLFSNENKCSHSW